MSTGLHYKRRPANENIDPYLELAGAVIRRAISDYTYMLRRGKADTNGLLARKFILSEDFVTYSLGLIDGQALLEKIEREVNAEKAA